VNDPSAVPSVFDLKRREWAILNRFSTLQGKCDNFRGGLISKSLCGIPYKKFFKIPQRPVFTLFMTFCMGDYKSLAAIAALPQWPVRPWIT
jgi:hypothetical protein